MAMDESLRADASSIAQKLRKAGRRVDLVLEPKKIKWVFKVRCSFLHWLHHSDGPLQQFPAARSLCNESLVEVPALQAFSPCLWPEKKRLVVQQEREKE